MLGLLAHHIGLGSLPVIIALSVYSWLPILRNTVAGLRGIDASVIEAARGLGVLIFQGITMMDNRVTLAGTIPVALLAIGLDQAIGHGERAIRRRAGAA